MTDPDLQVISGGLGEGPAEPGWTVELTTGAVATTPSTIPNRLFIECSNAWHYCLMISGITEIIIFDETG